MATTALEIVNAALGYVGENPITQTDFDTPPAANRTAVVAAREYPAARDEEQRLHPWVFTLVRATLAANATVPAYGFTHTVPAPVGLLRLLRVRHQVPYRAEGATFLTDATSLDVVYISRVTTPTLFDPAFDEVLKARLAMKFCYAITGKLPNLEALTQLYQLALQRAKEAFALEQGEGEWEEDPAAITAATIIQDAVARVLHQPMTGPLDPVDLTTMANRLYPALRDELQRSYAWVFTLTRATLTATAAVPAFGFAHTIAVPAGTLRVLRVRHQVPYRQEGAVLLTDATSLDVVSIARVTDPTRFDPMYRSTLTALLALRLAEALPVRGEGGAESRVATIKILAEMVTLSLVQAREVNAIEAGEGAYEENPAAATMGTIIQEAIARLMTQPLPGSPDPIDLTATANRLYPTLRDELQRSHPWVFTLVRATLTATAAVPAFGFAHTMTVPTDALRILRVRHGVPYRHEGAVLVTDAASLDVVYIGRVTDPTRFDAMYRHALTALLALRLAEGLPIRGEGGAEGRLASIKVLTELYAASIVQARETNAIEQGEGPYEASPLPDAMGALIQEAVGRLLAQPLAGTPDPIDLTTTANRLFPVLRDELTRSHPWVFALVRTTLTASATIPAHSFAHAIDVPADCLRLLRVRHGVPYRHEGAVLVTDAASLDVVYLRQITDVTLFDPTYRQTLVTLLALRLAEGLPARGDGASRQEAVSGLAAQFTAALVQARELNAIESGEGAYEENPADDTMGTIIQDAIGRLMAQPVQGAPDPIDLTAIANRLYPKLREELQRMHPWRFTRTRTRLDATTLTSLVPGAGAGTVTATGITFTTGGTFFEPSDVGLRLLGTDGGAARITAVTSATVAVATIEGPWTPLEPVAAGDWHRAPSWRWTYRYPKPAGFLRLLETQTPTYFGGEPVAWAWWSGWRWPVHTGTGQPWEEPAVLEGEWIVSDAGPTLNIEYVREITDPAAFEPSYAAVLAAFLAWRLALPAKQPPQIEQILGRAFATQLKSVRTADKHDTRVPPMRYSPLTMVRY